MGDDAAGSDREVTASTMTAKPRRLVRASAVVPAIALVAGAVVLWLQVSDPERRLGAEPTVTGTECGLGQAPSALLSIDAQTGELKWSRLVGDRDNYWPVGLATSSGTVVVFSEDGRIQGLDASDGSHRWCAQGGVVSAVDDRMFTIVERQTVEIDPASGRTERASADELAGLLEGAADPIAATGESYHWNKHGMDLTATRRSTGEVLWTRRVPGMELITTSDLVIVYDQSNGAFGFGGPGSIPDEYTMDAYRLDSGEKAWSIRLPSFGSMYLAGGVVYVSDFSSTIRAIDPSSGKVLWAVEHDNPGRTIEYSEVAMLGGVGVDSTTGDVMVLLTSRRPYRD